MYFFPRDVDRSTVKKLWYDYFMELSRLPSQPKEVKSAEEEYLTEACDRNEIDQLLNENDNHWSLSALFFFVFIFDKLLFKSTICTRLATIYLIFVTVTSLMLIKQDRETRSMAVPEVTIYNLLLKPQAFSFECLYLKKTTGNLSIYVPQK